MCNRSPLVDPITHLFRSVYAKNIEERVKIEPLKDTLLAIFEEFGTVLDIVVKKNLKAKGQAFIVFDNPDSALKAIEEAQSFELFDKPLVLQLAKTRSDATIKQSGNEKEFDTHKRRRLAEKGTSAH